MADIVSVFADCFAAVGTVGAFAVTLHLLRMELATRRSVQASLVSAWLPGALAVWRRNPRLRVSRTEHRDRTGGHRVHRRRGPALAPRVQRTTHPPTPGLGVSNAGSAASRHGSGSYGRGWPRRPMR